MYFVLGCLAASSGQRTRHSSARCCAMVAVRERVRTRHTDSTKMILQGAVRRTRARSRASRSRGSAVPGPLASSSWGWAETRTGTQLPAAARLVNTELR